MKAKPTSPGSGATRAGLVTASFGRHVLIETPQGERFLCHPRGKKNQAVVGDQVRWLPTEDEGTIEALEARRNLLYRQDELRTKSFAANLDQVLVLLAAEPEFSESQLARALIAARAQGIAVLIGLNKKDLGPLFDGASARLAPYRAMGHVVLALAVKPV
ncbi:MAG: GTPase RsgA, partial [Betaproteobacteria bacterium]